MHPSDQPSGRLIDAYAFPGFRPLSRVQHVPDDPQARVVTLRRREKKRSAAPAVIASAGGMTAGYGAYVICPVAMPVCTWSSRFDASIVRSAAR